MFSLFFGNRYYKRKSIKKKKLKVLLTSRKLKLTTTKVQI